jgi:hypothetical protein
VLTGALGYYGFTAIDTLGLGDRHGSATILGREYKPAGTSYQTTIIGGRSHAVPHTTGEMYLIGLRVDGVDTVAAVDRDLYQRLHEGDRVQVRYQLGRLTGDVQAVEITRSR